MSHHQARPIPAKRIYAMSRFNFTEDQLDVLQDGINEERNARAAAKGCSECNDTGCPSCWDTQDEDGEPVQENV